MIHLFCRPHLEHVRTPFFLRLIQTKHLITSHIKFILGNFSRGSWFTMSWLHLIKT